MALINSGKSIIRERNLSSFCGPDSINMICNKSHAQPEILSSCHEIENIGVFPQNRTILNIICLLTPILQGGIAFFAIFSTRLRFSSKFAQNEKESVVLPDSEEDLGFPGKSLIFKNNLSSFREVIRNRMISGKSHSLSSDLMSSRCVGII